MRDSGILADDMNIVDNLEFYKEFERRFKQFNSKLARIIKSKKDTGLSSSEFTNIISKVRDRILKRDSRISIGNQRPPVVSWYQWIIK